MQPGPLFFICAWAQIDSCSNMPVTGTTTEMRNFYFSNDIYFIAFKSIEIAFKNVTDWKDTLLIAFVFSRHQRFVYFL